MVFLKHMYLSTVTSLQAWYNGVFEAHVSINDTSLQARSNGVYEAHVSINDTSLQARSNGVYEAHVSMYVSWSLNK